MTGWLLNRYTRSEVLHKTTARKGGARDEHTFLSIRLSCRSFRSVSSHTPGVLRGSRREGDKMSRQDPEVLYRRANAANKRHMREFDRYTRMLTSGFTKGRFYSEQEQAEQLAKADEALEAAKAAQQAFDEAMNGDEEERADN